MYIPCPACCSLTVALGPGYSACPQMHLVTSSSGACAASSTISSSSSSRFFMSLSVRSALPLRLRRGAICSCCWDVSSSGESRGDAVRLFERAARSPLPFDEVEADEGVWEGPGGAGGCWELRAREERRGVIVGGPRGRRRLL